MYTLKLHKVTGQLYLIEWMEGEKQALGGWMDNRQLQGKSIWQTGTLSGDASCLSFTFILILIFQHFIYPLWASLKICLTEAGPLTLSEEGACQLLPKKEGSPLGKAGALPDHTPRPWSWSLQGSLVRRGLHSEKGWQRLPGSHSRKH